MRLMVPKLESVIRGRGSGGKRGEGGGNVLTFA